MHELFVLYAPLLRDQARKMSVPLGERDQLVDTVLDDIALHLFEVPFPPRELTTYIVSAFRNRVRSAHRDWQRSHATHDAREYGDSSESIVAECHSEFGMRASCSRDSEEESPLRSAIKKLADKSASELSNEELVLMVGVARHIPVRELAEQLGLTHGAARVKIHRLRARFVRLAIQYVATLEATERREIERFLRRAEVPLGEPVQLYKSGPGNRSDDEKD